ncbi:outer membrane protein assembly factor BamB family protein [Haladaptatus sp. NG-SE-30]
MNRRRFLKTAGIMTTVGLAGSRAPPVRAAEESDTETGGEWTHPWGTAGRTRTTAAPGSAGPYARPDWEYQTNSWLSGTPTISNGILYTGRLTDDVAFQGAITAIDVETGERIWANGGFNDDDTIPYKGYAYPAHSPVVENGTVFFAGQSPDEFERSVDGVYTLDAESGEQSWARTDLSEYSTLTVSNGLVYLRGRTLNAENGETEWETTPDEKVVGVTDGTLYTYYENEEGLSIIARDATDGSEHWRTTRSNDEEWLPKAVTTDSIYLVGPQRAGEDRMPPRVGALSTTDGHLRWKTTVEARDGTIGVSAPAVDEKNLYLVTRGDSQPANTSRSEPVEGVGTVFALDTEMGEERWRFETPAYLHGAPTVGTGAVYVTAQYHACPDSPTRLASIGLYALDSSTGDEQWSYAVGHQYVTYAPAVAGDRVYLSIHGPGGTLADATIYSFCTSDCQPDCENQFADDENVQITTSFTDPSQAAASTTEPATRHSTTMSATRIDESRTMSMTDSTPSLERSSLGRGTAIDDVVDVDSLFIMR